MKVILFGATGMVGQGVLRECLLDGSVERVVAVGRTPTGIAAAKLHELIRRDMFDFRGAEELHGCEAYLFCLGVSSLGMSEADYTRLTYDLTLGWARTLARIDPTMTFIYVSGAGTGGKAMWARVKRRTEEALLDLFPNAYLFRPAAIRPMHGEVSKTRWTRIGNAVAWPILPLLHAIAPGAIVTTEELGRAMIHVARHGAPKHVLENRDLRALVAT